MFYGAFILIAFGAGGCTSVVTMTAGDSYHAISKHHGCFKDELRSDGCRDSAVEHHRSIRLWLARRYFRKKYVMAISYSLMALGMLALCHIKLTGMIYIFLFFFSNGFGGIATLRGALLREYYGKKNFGKYLGIMMGFGACGGIIGPTTAGWVFDMTGSYYFVWLALSALIGLAIILIWRIESKDESSLIKSEFWPIFNIKIRPNLYERLNMKPINISQNIVSLSDFKNKASKMLHEIQSSRCPLVITQNGKAAAVLISPSDFDLLTEQARFVEAVQRGLEDVQNGRVLPDEDLDKEL